MTALLPRLDSEHTRALIDAARGESVSAIAERMPARNVRTHSSPLGGLELSDADLAAVRSDVVALARNHGYPGEGSGLPLFDAKCARLVHDSLRISPHEASEEDVWSHLTCAWLLDVAAWRWGGVGESDRRFRGDLNRNTFRRLWWRAEVLGPGIDLSQLGEDELVNVMERPTIAANRPLARSLARQFLDRVADGDTAGRMMLMREAGKRLVRLTPILDFFAMTEAELDRIVEAVLLAAREGGNVALSDGEDPVAPSEGVERLERLAPVAVEASPEDESIDLDPAALEEYGEVAVGIAARTGRVTNSALREVVPLEAAESRRVLQDLVARARLARRGRAKGTYYVLPGEQVEIEHRPSDLPAQPTAPTIVPSPPQPRQPATALRRFLRRRR